MIFLRLFAGYFLQIIPFAVLGLYPFARQFRFPVTKVRLYTIALICFLDCIFSGLGCLFCVTIPDLTQRFNMVNVVFLISLIPYFFWLFFVSKAIWQKKLFVFSFLLTSAFSMISVCNLLSTYLLRHDEIGDGLPYRGVSLLVIFVFTVILTPLLFLILRKGYVPVADSLSKKESAYLAVLSLMLFVVLAGGLLFCDYSSMFEPFLLFMYLALLAAVFFIYAVFFRILLLNYEKAAAKQESEALKHQLEIREEQYYRFNERIEQNRRMHHDLKHHMLTIRGFLDEGRTQEAENYLEHCIETAEKYEIARLCDVPVINWVVSYYQALANSRNIPFAVRISTPPAEEIAIHDADLSVLLGNLLENAVTAAEPAAEEARYIRLTITHSGNMLVITVDNGFAGAPNTDGRYYYSTKEEHTGIGMRSIEDIAEKYGGGAEFSHEASEFHSSVMMNIRGSIL